MLNGKKISIIVALGNDNVIGKDNDLPWPRIREDMRYFQKTTTPHSVIMGRKTWDSIPEKFRPLRDRENIVLSRNPTYEIKETEVVLARTFEEGIRSATSTKVFVIGGAAIYKEALPHADTLHITRVSGNYTGDVFFPQYDTDAWMLNLDYTEQGHTMDGSTIPIKFQIYSRK